MEVKKLSVEKLWELLPEWSLMTHYRITKGYVFPSKKYWAALNARLSLKGLTVESLYREEEGVEC